MDLGQWVVQDGSWTPSGNYPETFPSNRCWTVWHRTGFLGNPYFRRNITGIQLSNSESWSLQWTSTSVMPRLDGLSIILSIWNFGQVSIPVGNISNFVRRKCNTTFVGIVLSSFKYAIGRSWFKIDITICISVNSFFPQEENKCPETGVFLCDGQTIVRKRRMMYDPTSLGHNQVTIDQHVYRANNVEYRPLHNLSIGCFIRDFSESDFPIWRCT